MFLKSESGQVHFRLWLWALLMLRYSQALAVSSREPLCRLPRGFLIMGGHAQRREPASARRDGANVGQYWK